MAFDKAFRTPAVLSGVARGTIEGVLGGSIVSDYFTVKQNQGLTFDFTVGQAGLPESARFRSFNTESDQTADEGVSARHGKLPPISRRHNVDEYSHLKLIGGDLGAEFEAKTERIAAQIAMRLIEAAAETIETGKLNIAERNLAFELDFGRKAGLTDTAAALWSDPDAAVIDDLEALRAAYGRVPGGILMSDQVLQLLTKNVELIKYVVGRGTDLPDRVSIMDVLSALASFGFSNVLTNSERLIDHSGNERALFSPGKVIFLPGAEQTALTVASGSGPLGTIDFGITAEALDADNGVGGTPGAFAGAIRSHDPEGYDVLVSAIALPVNRNANATASLQVL